MNVPVPGDRSLPDPYPDHEIIPPSQQAFHTLSTNFFYDINKITSFISRYIITLPLADEP